MARDPLRPPPLAPDPRRVYHSLLPHPALSPVPDAQRPATIKEQQENESAYRQLLVQGALALLLPTEDFENACVRTLVAEVLGEMIVGNVVGGKLCDGRFLMEAVVKLVKLVDLVQDNARSTGRGARGSSSTRSNRRGTTGSNETQRSRSCPGWGSAGVQLAIWQLLQLVYSFFPILRFVVVALLSHSSLPSRTPKETPASSASRTPRPQAPSAPVFPAMPRPPPAATRARSQDRPRSSEHDGPRRRGRPRRRPILQMRIWSCLSNVVHLTRRMPWLEGMLKLVRHGLVYGPGGVGDTDGIVDR